MGNTGEEGLPGVKGSSPASHELAETVLLVTSEGRGLPRVTCPVPVLSGGAWAEAEPAGKTVLSSRHLLPAEACGGCQRRLDWGTQHPRTGCVLDSTGGPGSSRLPGSHSEGQPGPQPTGCQPVPRRPLYTPDTSTGTLKALFARGHGFGVRESKA